MLNVYATLLQADNVNTQRQLLQEAWVETLEKHLGKFSRTDLVNMTLEEINERVFGVPYSSPILKNVRLRDLTDPKIVDSKKYAYYLNSIKEKLDTLKRIFMQGDYKYAFWSNEVEYYWIDGDLLP